MKNFISKRTSFIKASLLLFSKKLFVFSALFLFSAPNSSQAHSTHSHSTHSHSTHSHSTHSHSTHSHSTHSHSTHSHSAHPGGVCFNPSSVCQTFSGNICPLTRHYAPQSFSACLTSGFFYLCYQSPQIFYQNPVCISKGSPCVCLSPQINHWTGASYYIYEQGHSF